MSRRRTVARTLRGLVLVLVLIIVAVALVSAASVVIIQREITAAARTITPMAESSSEMRINVTDAQTAYRAVIISDDHDYVEAYQAEQRSYQESLREFEELADERVDPQVLQRFAAAGERWFELADAELEKHEQGEPTSIAASGRAFDDVVSTHAQLVTEVTDARQQVRQRYRAVMNGAIALIVGMALVAVAVTTVRSHQVIRRLAGPLEDLEQVVARQRRGDTRARADERRGAVEVVAVASAVNALADANDEMLSDRERRLRLYAVSGAVAAHLTSLREHGSDEACRVLAEGLAADGVALYAASETRPVLLGTWRSPRAAWRAPLLGEVRQEGHAEMLAEAPVLVAGSAEEIETGFPVELAALAGAEGVGSWVLHPLVLSGEALGVLSVAGTTGRAWTDDELRTIERVAELASQALAERRYVAELEALDQQKSDFMATTSHELRTPLTSIAGYLELLEDGDLGALQEAQAQALHVVSRNVTRLRALIDDLLLLNRLEGGEAAPDLRELDLRDVVHRVAEQIRPVAERSRVRLVVDEGVGAAPARADRDQLERALGNLVSNAVKFTPAGGRVTVRASAEVDDVVLRCQDTGMGIPEQEVGRLFQRFYRASNAQQQQVQGTGLGLVIVRTIAEAHGGSVHLDSQEGVGTTVTITLPRADRPSSGDPGAAPAAAARPR